MSSPFNSDDEVLARLVREAGDPSISPDPKYAETLRTTILDRVDTLRTVSHPTEAIRDSEVSSIITKERARKMKRIAKFAVAATVLVAVGILMLRTTIGGSGNIVFADVAKVLDSLRSATYDFTSEIKNPVDGTTTTTNSKGYFLAPSLERVEMSMSTGSSNDTTSSIMILDCLAAKAITLLPEQKKAVIIKISMTEPSTGGTSNMFEMVRRMVREGSASSGEKIESLGEKAIDGRSVVGFRTHNNMGDMTFWADPQTARLVRVDIDRFAGSGHAVMSNFRYDMELEPSLFSLEPPAGYTVQTQTVTQPVEEDLVNVLRFVAEHNDSTFPDSIGANDKALMQAVQAEAKSASEKLLKTPEAQELMKQLKAQYGEDMEGFKKAWMKEWMEMAGPITQKRTQQYMRGVMFYATLQPENDSHYAGKNVKLDTPDRPILWYKPTGSGRYRVIYADLSIKEMAPEDVEKLRETLAG